VSNHLWKIRFCWVFVGTHCLSGRKAKDIQMLIRVFEEETVTLDR